MKKYSKPTIDILDIEISTLLAASDPIVDPSGDNEIDRSKGHSFSSIDVWGLDDEE
ncbi:MAG: hypothetical protein J6K19_04650 [Prevotella sp.]|nr:hypothetical protein [Prevotella sp.]